MVATVTSIWMIGGTPMSHQTIGCIVMSGFKKIAGWGKGFYIPRFSSKEGKATPSCLIRSCFQTETFRRAPCLMKAVIPLLNQSKDFTIRRIRKCCHQICPEMSWAPALWEDCPIKMPGPLSTIDLGKNFTAEVTFRNSTSQMSKKRKMRKITFKICLTAIWMMSTMKL